MKKICPLIAVMILTASFFSASPVLAQTTVTSFTPTSACVGTTPTITINGTGFLGATSVTFNGTPTSFTVVSPIQITAPVPASATIGVIQIVSPSGTGVSATNFSINPLTPVMVSIQAVAPSPNTGMGPFNTCNGAVYYFTSSITNGGSTPAIQWYDGATLIGTNIMSPVCNVTGSSIIHCTVTYGGVGLNCPDGIPATSNSIFFNSVVTPNQPSTIIGLSTVCANQTGVLYNANCLGAATYTWTTPGGTIASGQGTGTITVNWGSTPGVYVMTVVGVNMCGVPGVQRNKTITVNPPSCIPQVFISGHVYCDINNNGAFDVTEPLLNNQQVSLQSPVTTLLTWSNGYYAGEVDSGQSYQVTAVPPAGWQITSSPAVYSINVSNVSVTGIDFGIFPLSPLPADVSLTMTTQQPLCNANRVFTLHCHNTGMVPASGTVQFTFDSLMTYVSATPVPALVTGNVITWNYANLLFNQPQTIQVTFHLPGPQNIIVNSATISALDSLSNVIDSSACSSSQVVLCSFDPNDKTVSPYIDGSQNYTSMNSWLDYTIRFQNTGTAPAMLVNIVDTLSSFLDVGSLQLISSSHPMTVSVEGGNILSFRFDNINLPDSNSNEPASHGYVTFRIRPIGNLSDPSVINNTSYIFFDSNAPVQTNTTINTMTNNIVSAQENSNHAVQSILLIPNPTTNELRIESSKLKVENIEMYNTLGERVLISEIDSEQTTIDIHSLPAGIYFIKFLVAQKMIVKKVVKM